MYWFTCVNLHECIARHLQRRSVYCMRYVSIHCHVLILCMYEYITCVQICLYRITCMHASPITDAWGPFFFLLYLCLFLFTRELYYERWCIVFFYTHISFDLFECVCMCKDVCMCCMYVWFHVCRINVFIHSCMHLNIYVYTHILPIYTVYIIA